MLPRWHAPRVLDAGGGIVHPGFIDAHLHINAQTCRGFFQGDSSRGGGTGPNYADWKAALRPEDEHAAAALGCLELLRHGYTAFVEPGSAFEPDAIAAAAEATGVRCSLADPYLWDDPSLMDVIAGLKSPSLFARVPPTRERSLTLLGGQLHRNRRSRRHRPRPRRALRRGHRLRRAPAGGQGPRRPRGRRAQLPPRLRPRHGCGHGGALGAPALRAPPDLGVLGPNATFVHMNVIRDGDVEPILASGLSAVWCPLAYLQKGIPLRLPTRIPEMRRRGASVALGTDSARQSTVGDAPFLAVHLAAEAGQPIASEDAIEMATLGAARAAGLDRLLGSLEPGKRADLVVRQRDAVELGPGRRARPPARHPRARPHGRHGARQRPGGARGRPLDPRQRSRGDRRGAPSASRMAARLGLGTPGRWPRR